MTRLSAATTALIAALLFATVGCGGKGKEGVARQAPPVIKEVALLAVQEEAIPDYLTAVGTVRARNSAVIAARLPGTVTAVFAREGERVARGKALLAIEAAESAAGAAGAQAGVEEALRGVEEARARQGLGEATFERYRKLFQEQAVTRQEYEGRQMERDVAAQGLARSEARLAQAREGAKAAQVVAGRARVTSPLAGVVTAKAVDTGVTVFPGMPLFTVEEEGHYRLEAAVPEAFMGKVRPGDAVRVAIDGAGEFSGRVAETAPAADQASRTFTVKVEIGGKGVRSGIFGRAFFPAGARRGVLLPKSAVTERGALTSVWVVGKDNIARLRLVKAGQAVNGRIEILTGLSAGERVVVGGAERVVDGARIE
jgi:membrane fusion protein, multidrug efflux system